MTVFTPTDQVPRDDSKSVQTKVPTQRPAVIHGRPRSVEGEEAYERSAKEQAAIDIAAGW